MAWPTASCKRLQTNNQTVSMLVLRGRCAEIDGLLASCADRGLDRRYGARGVRGVIGGTARSGVTSSARDDGAREAAHARGSSRSSRSDGAPDQQPLQPIVLTLYWRAWTSCKRTVLQKQRYTVSLFRRRAPVLDRDGRLASAFGCIRGCLEMRPQDSIDSRESRSSREQLIAASRTRPPPRDGASQHLAWRRGSRIAAECAFARFRVLVSLVRSMRALYPSIPASSLTGR